MNANRRAAAEASAEIVAINSVAAKKPRRARAPVVATPAAELARDPVDASNESESTTHEALAEADTFSTGKITKPPSVRPPETPKTALLQTEPGIDDDECFGEEERLLSEFVRLHPVLSLESTSQRTLQLLSDLTDKYPIPTQDLELIGKRHDDAYLRPPRLDLDERPCCLGNRCLCVWLARWRYGADSDLAFVCREFLTPAQQAGFERNSKLPSNCGKCLVCTRYAQTYVYRVARADPTFVPSAKIPLQAFGNLLGVERGDNAPHAASVALDADGYRQSALLYVDEEWADSAASRSAMSGFLWKPVVKFSSTHYVYVRDGPDGTPRIVQVGVGTEDEGTQHANEFPHFTPPARQAPPPSAASARTSTSGCGKNNNNTTKAVAAQPQPQPQPPLLGVASTSAVPMRPTATAPTTGPTTGPKAPKTGRRPTPTA